MYEDSVGKNFQENERESCAKYFVCHSVMSVNNLGRFKNMSEMKEEF